MRRIPIFFLAALLVGALLPKDMQALTDEEKRELFLKAREEMKTVPAKEASPTPKPKPKAAARRSRKKKPTAERTPKPAPERTPRPTPEETPEKSPKPSRRVEPEETPRKPVATPIPAPAATPTPAPEEPAAVVIQKSGLEEESGFVPPPPPTRRSWFWGTSPSYKYITRSVQDQIDRARVKQRRWRYIVVHNSGTRQGNARIFDYYHRHTRRMQNGLAYHFVIGNGSSSGDGQIEIGNRWREQLQGGHVHSDYLNNVAIGICLVGDFNRQRPSQAQLDSLEELIRYLRGRVGKIDRRPAIVKPHRDINPPRWPTDCPGDRFPFSWLHRFD